MPRLVSARAHACGNGLGNRGPLRLSLGKIMNTWIISDENLHIFIYGWDRSLQILNTFLPHLSTDRLL